MTWLPWCIKGFLNKLPSWVPHIFSTTSFNNMFSVFVFLLVYVLSGRPKSLSTREISTGLVWLYARRFSGLRYVFRPFIGLFVPSYFVFCRCFCVWMNNFMWFCGLFFLILANQLASNYPLEAHIIFSFEFDWIEIVQLSHWQRAWDMSALLSLQKEKAKDFKSQIIKYLESMLQSQQRVTV